MKEDNKDTEKIEVDLKNFEIVELSKIKISKSEVGQTYEPTYKPYNLNTKYGSRKAREQALQNYENETSEYRKDIDNMKAIIWVVIIVIAVIFSIIKTRLL